MTRRGRDGDTLRAPRRRVCRLRPRMTRGAFLQHARAHQRARAPQMSDKSLRALQRSPTFNAFTKRHASLRQRSNEGRSKEMGKYFLAWLLGVPFFVLVLIYLFFH